MLPMSPTLPLVGFKTLLPNPETTWMVSPPLFNPLQDVPEKGYRKSVQNRSLKKGD